MKRLIYILALISASVFFNGCDSLWNFNYHYVTFSNTDQFKYVTSVYYKDISETKWSKDQAGTDIYPGENLNVMMNEGTYDFEIIMEDDDYSYTFYYDSVSVYDDITLEIYYEGMKDAKVKIEKKIKPSEK